MRIFRIVAVLGLLLSLPTPVSRLSAEEAPAADALQAATELFSLLSPDLVPRLVSQMTDVLWPMIERQARAENIDDATLADLRKEFDRIQLANVTEMMKEAPPIYARYFTGDELRQLLDFYKSPVGQKAIKALPQVMGDFLARVQPYMQAAQQQASDAFTRILGQHGYKQ